MSINDATVDVAPVFAGIRNKPLEWASAFDSGRRNTLLVVTEFPDGTIDSFAHVRGVEGSRTVLAGDVAAVALVSMRVAKTIKCGPYESFAPAGPSFGPSRSFTLTTTVGFYNATVAVLAAKTGRELGRRSFGAERDYSCSNVESLWVSDKTEGEVHKSRSVGINWDAVALYLTKFVGEPVSGLIRP
jgi:hypothetical protein